MKTGSGRLLIVEDEDDIASYLAMELEAIGLVVTRAANGSLALEIYKKEANFDAILSDITMPSMSGIELLTEIRKLGKNIPFVILSAHGTNANLEKALQLGAFDFIEKPWKDENLIETILRAIELGKMIHFWESDPALSGELENYLKENARRTENEAKGILKFPNRQFAKK